MSADLAPHGLALVAAMPHLHVTAAPEPDDITWHQADEITRKIRSALLDLTAAVDDFTVLVERAWASRADIALGYPSWADYCADIFADVRGIRLPAPTRQAVVLALRTSGMSTRAMASAVGIDKKTVMADLRLVQNGPDATSTEQDCSVDRPATVTSLDGRQRPATSPRTSAPTPRRRTTDRIVELIAAAGDEGMTVREVGRRLRLHHGQASGALSRLERQGRVVRTSDRREGYSVYRLPT